MCASSAVTRHVRVMNWDNFNLTSCPFYRLHGNKIVLSRSAGVTEVGPLIIIHLVGKKM